MFALPFGEQSDTINYIPFTRERLLTPAEQKPK